MLRDAAIFGRDANVRILTFPAPLSAWSLASAVTSFAMLGAGFALVLMTRLTGTQPRHWCRAYVASVFVGIATLGLHALGEPAGGRSLAFWSIADTGTNLVLAFAVVLALLRDFVAPVARRRAVLSFAVLNAVALAHVTAERLFGGSAGGIRSASFGSLTWSQLALVVDYAAAVALFVNARDRIPMRSRALLPLLGLAAATGPVLAMPDGERIDALVVAYHAIWHLVGAFLMLLIWIVNELRFSDSGVDH
jgi:hypothetical protein